MGDPFSIAVGILAVLDASTTVGRFLKDVVKLRKAPDILLGLNNELVDLQLLVQRVHGFLQENSELVDQSPDEGLLRSLGKTRAFLHQFEKLLAYDFTVLRTKSGQLELDKSRWIRAISKVERLRDDIRSSKINLGLALTVLIRYDFHHLFIYSDILIQ